MFPFSLPYRVEDDAQKRGDAPWEAASFYIHDMGELYRVGILRLTPAIRQIVKTPEGGLSPTALSWLGIRQHLGDRERRTGEWKPVSKLEPIETPHGRGVLSVNQVEGGRFLEGYVLDERGKTPLPQFPATVVVIAVQRGEPEALLLLDIAPRIGTSGPLAG